MITVRSTINLAHQSVPNIIPVVQGDTGRAILFTLADFTIPEGATARYFVVKPSGLAVYNDATIDGNTVLVELTAQSIIETGDNYGQVRISVGEDIVTSFDFILHVDPFRGIDAVESTTEMNIFDALVTSAVDEAREQIEDIAEEVIETIPDDYTALSNEVDDLKDALTYTTGIYSSWLNGRITTNTDPVALTPVIDSQTWFHVIIPCVAEDSFHVIVSSAHSSARPWTFVDSTYHVLSQATINAVDTDITAPATSAYLICNSRNEVGVIFNNNNQVSDKINSAVSQINSEFSYYQRYVQTITALDYDNKLANVTGNVISNASASDGWTDLPVNVTSGIFENRRYSNLYQIQFIRGIAKETSEYTRIVKRSDGTVYRDWVLSYRTPLLRILAVGDSICLGGRNDNKGFVGDLGFPYINMGVGGATLSSIHSTYNDSIHQFSDANNIPNQLVSYSGKTNTEIQTAFGVAKFDPDIIIVDGGINDYNRNGTLGTLSTIPVSNDTEASALNRNTVYGALEYLFYQMIKIYPMAQRYFVITHKTLFATVTPPRYAPTTKNVEGTGFNQQELHDAIVDACKLYGVITVDVYSEGIMDTLFSAYRTEAESWRSALATDYCDKDGIHPLSYGYTQVYCPLVKCAIGNATRK